MCLKPNRLKEIVNRQNTLKDLPFILSIEKMNIKQFINTHFEKEYPVTRSITVDIVNGVKKPKGEKNNMSLVEIASDRGVGNTLSIYLKHIKNLYLIDFDKAGKFQSWNDYNNKDTCLLYKFLIDNNVAYTVTTKGVHFYTLIDNVPQYTNEQKVSAVPFYEIDLIHRCNNSWEDPERKVIGELKSFDWSQFQNFFDLSQMNRSKQNVANTQKRDIKLDTSKYNYDISDDMFNKCIAKSNVNVI